MSDYDTMSFSSALDLIKHDKKATRLGWNGKGMWIALYKYPEGDEDGRRPYIFMKTVNNETVPWVASQTDLLSDDWVVVY